ncbi:uncharacterized protein BT62DRAFT_1003145 [Guyanagaster necrorhizus]|uniref:Pheromone receptor n=1 Tax=Guyanagaster necrorhizus TaxID=856835 RepID=A0A9P8AUF3_9AGAR|nr:uncharacterized protein BT62DRAFT_1003145 [Guyanagaster necrorhizus MCA 3950]KAG7448429.1 hypothetical protein BT62DRAFT_1003145 [Guyanagaster necrorhizus MCA 3950]
MFVGLPIASFFFVAVLAVLVFFRPVKSNAALITLVLWSVFCNIILGIDAILWADNTNIHIPVWCDICEYYAVILVSIDSSVERSIKNTFGVAYSIRRSIFESFPGPRGRFIDQGYLRRQVYKKSTTDIQHTIMFSCPHALCHTPVDLFFQYHRFDIVQNFGCFASIRPSALSFVMMIIPSLILCVISFVASGFTFHRIYCSTSSEFTEHLSLRSSLTLFSFRCRLATTTLVTLATMITSIVIIAAQVAYAVPRTSSQDTYHRVFPIAVVKDSRSAQAAWWGVFTVSLLISLISFIEMGKEINWKWLTCKTPRLSRRVPSQDIILPSYRGAVSTPAALSRTSLSHYQPKPQNVDLVSGWDDMLSLTPPKKSKSPPPPPSPLLWRDKPSRQDEAFAADTLNYLRSSAARSLDVPTPEDHSRASSPYVVLKLIVPDSAHETESELYRRCPSLLEDATSTISSFCDIPWPLPPPDIPASPGRFSVIDAAEYPITCSLLEQRKTAPLRIPSRKRYLPDAIDSAQRPIRKAIIQMVPVSTN